MKRQTSALERKSMYLRNLFDVNDVLGVFSVGTNDLGASSNLDSN